MKYLKYNEARETLIDKKIIFLEDIAADMRDAGMDVKIFNGSDSSLFGTRRMWMASGHVPGGTSNVSKYIYAIVMKSCNRANGLEGPQETPEFKEFFERLKASGIGYRFMSVGETYAVPEAGGAGGATGYVVVGIDKRSRLSRQEIQNLI
jgi:hypothetical protein